MKQLFFLGLAAIACLHARSQDESVIIHASTKVSKKMTPKQVIDSLNARFPDAHAIKYYKIPPDAVSNGWSVSKDDNLASGQAVDYYTIKFKRSDMKYYGLFAADGRLIRSKQEETADKLPEAVKFSMKALGEQHPGYTVVSKKFYRNLSASTDDQFYEIIAKKGDEKKSLYYKPDGTLVEIK